MSAGCTHTRAMQDGLQHTVEGDVQHSYCARHERQTTAHPNSERSSQAQHLGTSSYVNQAYRTHASNCSSGLLLLTVHATNRAQVPGNTGCSRQRAAGVSTLRPNCHSASVRLHNAPTQPHQAAQRPRRLHQHCHKQTDDHSYSGQHIPAATVTKHHWACRVCARAALSSPFAINAGLSSCTWLS